MKFMNKQRNTYLFIFLGIVLIGASLSFAAKPFKLESDNKIKNILSGYTLDGPLRNFHIDETPQAVPQIAFMNVDGNDLTLSAFKGKVILLNFWATWCPPCLEEMPALNDLNKKYKDQDFKVVTLSFDRVTPDRIVRFFQKNNLDSLEIYIDKQEQLAQALNTFALPSSFIIDKDGYILGKMEGPADWNSEEVHKLIDFILSQK